MLAALSPARRRFVLVVVAVACAVVVPVAAVVARRAAEDPHPVAQNGPGPVLLVPGYGGSTASLDALASVLRQRGRDATVVRLVGDGTGDLHAEAQVLGSAADDALARTGAGSVDVIGYSAGGVVARLWVRDYGGDDLARRVVTLGSPQHGTDVAALAVDVLPGECPTACRQLAPDSDLLRALNAGDETPDGPRFISIWTTADHIVTPPDSARLDGAVNIPVQTVCADSSVSHGRLPTDPLVVAILALEIGAAPPVVPTPADCSRLSS